MSRAQPFRQDENPDFDPQNLEHEVIPGVDDVEGVDDTLDAPSSEFAPVPEGSEPVSPNVETASVVLPEIEPATLSELEAKFGQQKWEKGEQFASDWHLDFNTREIFNSKGESQTQLFQSSAEHSAKHQAMIDELVGRGTHYLEPHITDKEFIITIVTLQADGKVTFETFKHAIEQEVKPEEPSPAIENIEDGDDDEEVASVATGYSIPTLSFSPEKTVDVSVSVPTPEIQPAPAIAEVQAPQQAIIVENNKFQPVEQESFFQIIMRESRATVEQSAPVERHVEKIPDAIISTPLEVKKIVEIKEVVRPAVIAVEQAKDVTFLPQVNEKKTEAEVGSTVDNLEKIEKKVDANVPSVKVSERRVETHAIDQVEITLQDDVTGAVEKNTAETANIKIEEAEPVLKVQTVEAQPITELTYEEIVALETGISLESEDTVEVDSENKSEVPKVAELFEISEHRESPVTVAHAGVDKGIIKKEPTIEHAGHQEKQIFAEDTGIELVEFDQEPEPAVEVVTVAAKESRQDQAVVVKPALVATETEYTPAIEAGIKLVEIETERVVVGETEVRVAVEDSEKNIEIEVVKDKTATVPESTQVEIKEVKVVTETKTGVKEIVVEKPAAQEFVLEKAVESENVDKPEVVQKEKPELIIKDIPHTEITVKSEPKKVAPEVVIKKNKIENVVSVGVVDDNAVAIVRPQPAADSVNKKNNHESLIMKQPSGVVIISEDEENEIRSDRELEAFEVAFA